jgi:hypothetical protein
VEESLCSFRGLQLREALVAREAKNLLAHPRSQNPEEILTPAVES